MRPTLDGDHGLQLLQTVYVPKLLGLSETLICKIITPSGKILSVRALIDGGSQITALKRSIATELHLKGENKTLIIGTSGAQKLKYTDQIVTYFQLASKNKKFITDFMIEAITMPQVTMDINPITINPNNHEHLKQIEFTEELPFQRNTPVKVDLLIGQPIASNLLLKIICGKSINEPAAAIYKIGACLTGASSLNKGNQVSLFSAVEILPETVVDIKNWFSLENLGIENPTEEDQLTVDEQKAEDLMQQNTYYDKINKCWHTKLLWADKPIQYTNIKRATVTASRVIKRFSQEKYNDSWNGIQNVYATNLDLGITELVPKDDMKKENNFHYICMSMVFKPESITTPVRPVFNANLEMGIEKTSFNASLLEGPNLLQQLPQLMLKFRCYSTVALLDISKLYSRIRLSKEDSDYQRFFWSNTKIGPTETKANLKSYRQNRLVFGSKSSPYQAQWVLKKHAKLFGNEHLKNNAYLDDIFVGDNSPQKVLTDLKQLIWVLNQGDFPSQKIVSNSKLVLDGLDEDLKGPTKNTKIYGQHWDLENDKLTFNFKKDVNTLQKVFTKRQLLAEMMSLYDLLGFVQPFHLKAKLIFQESCKLSMKWDDLLPQNLQIETNKWVQQLPLLNKITVNRCFLPPDGGKICFIASFSDASNVGLGVNTYIISEDKFGQRKSCLAFCKAKVLPLKANYTTPRGELVAAQLNARAGNYVADAMTPVVGHKLKVYYFSDSEITLWRLLKPAETYKVWVANRLKAIQTSTNVEDWKKVDTADNPADISSRGADLSDFVDSDLFWFGPNWLLNPDTKYKTMGAELPPNNVQMDLEEVSKRTSLSVNACMLKNDVMKDILAKFNDWHKVINTIAWCKRFIKNLTRRGQRCLTRRGQRKAKSINYEELYLLPEEIQETERVLFQYAQKCEFANEVACLSQGLDIEKNSKLKTLIPFWDADEKLLKHSSRIVGYNPPILPKDHEVTRLFIHDIHKKFGHSGPSLTLYKVRKRVWITNGRQQVRKALYKCSCRKNILLKEVMGKIPAWRNENPTIWSRVGTDVLGPFWVKKDDGEFSKTFAILWTDLVSRGVMVDLLYSADTEGVLRSLRKLTAIYGAGSIYYSDNASYYKKASLELKNFMSSIDWPKIRKEASKKWNAQWLFATAASPFRNATSERLVRTIKESLAKVIKKNSLNFQEFSTTLLEISSFINNRPIGFLTSDSEDDMKPISPSLLTIGREIEILGEYQGKDPDLLELYNHRTKTVTDFLKNWTALYLQNLSPTKKWLTKNPYQIKEGMILFIKDENRLKDLWHKGRVTKIIRSKTDNVPRTIELKTRTGKIIRPIQKLAIPEWQILDEHNETPSSNLVTVSVENIAFPEITENNDLNEYLSLAPGPHTLKKV